MNADWENLFCVFDFPGFNDKDLDEQLLDVLKNTHNKFDLLVYVMECKECLRKASAQEYFDKTMKIIESRINKGQLKLMILFNKFDEVALRSKDKQSLKEQQLNIHSQLQTKYKIKQQYISNINMFNISANRLLAHRVIKNNDYEFLKDHGELMDDIAQYSLKWFTHDQILEDEDILDQKSRLEKYSVAMNKSLAEDDGKDELKQDTVTTGTNINNTSEKPNPNRNKNLHSGLKGITDNGDQVRDEFSSYRSPLAISNKIIGFIESASHSSGSFDINHCKKLFDPIRAVLNFVNKDNVKSSIDDTLVRFKVKLHDVIDEKLNKWFDGMITARKEAQTIPVTNRPYPSRNSNELRQKHNRLKLFETSLRYALGAFSQSVVSGIFSEEDIRKYATKLTKGKLLTHNVLIGMKSDYACALSCGNNVNGDKNNYNYNVGSENYFKCISQVYVTETVSSFVNAGGSGSHVFGLCVDTYYGYWYGKGHNCNDAHARASIKHHNVMPNKIIQLGNHIVKYYHDNKAMQTNLLKKMILAYDRYFDKSKYRYGKVIDLMQFYFDMNELKQLFTEYHQWNVICCKTIVEDDYTFGELIKLLRSSTR